MRSTDDQLEELREVIYKTKATIERVEATQDKDRQDFSEFKNRLGHLEQEFKSLKELITKLPAITQDKVIESVQALIQEIGNLSEQIAEKRTMVIRPKHKSSWRFWKRG